MSDGQYVQVDALEDPPADKELDALADLLKTDGWRVFCEYVTNEWTGPRVIEKMRLVDYTGATATEAKTQERCGQILAQVDAIDAVMSWPVKRIQQLSPSSPNQRRVRVSRRARA